MGIEIKTIKEIKKWECATMPWDVFFPYFVSSVDLREESAYHNYLFLRLIVSLGRVLGL